jgi:hypothetical protein
MTNENGNRTPAGGVAVKEKAASDNEREIKTANGERRRTQSFIGNLS